MNGSLFILNLKPKAAPFFVSTMCLSIIFIYLIIHGYVFIAILGTCLGLSNPFSVIKLVMNFDSVMSNEGFRIFTPRGGFAHTSRGSRYSIGTFRKSYFNSVVAA